MRFVKEIKNEIVGTLVSYLFEDGRDAHGFILYDFVISRHHKQTLCV